MRRGSAEEPGEIRDCGIKVELSCPPFPAPNKTLALELARSEYLDRRENVLLLGNSGTGKAHIALALRLAACQRGHRVRFLTAAALVGELTEARDEKYLRRFQKQLAAHELLIIDELGYVPLSRTGAELLFETISHRYERASTLITGDLPFDEWTEILGSERLTGALLDRITHHVHIPELNADSYRPRLHHAPGGRADFAPLRRPSLPETTASCSPGDCKRRERTHKGAPVQACPNARSG